jgi:hypothetical protein
VKQLIQAIKNFFKRIFGRNGIFEQAYKLQDKKVKAIAKADAAIQAEDEFYQEAVIFVQSYKQSE